MHLEELKYRKRALRRLGFCTNDDVVEMKGRVACEISTGDELLLTEMVFNGVFNDLTPEQCAALLSCFVFDEKVDDRCFSVWMRNSADGLSFRVSPTRSLKKSLKFLCARCRNQLAG